MLEVTCDNFNQLLPRIEKLLKSAKFIALDVEFSALNPLGTANTSLFDTPHDRYQKLYKTFEHVIPLQVGLTPFTFNPDNNAYCSETFSFYLFPKPFGGIDKTFICQSSSLQFLCTYKFDFNKFVYSGIPYINRTQEHEIHRNLKAELAIYESKSDIEAENVLSSSAELIGKWILTSKDNETLVLPDIYEKYKHNLELLYYLRCYLHSRFKGKLWTFIESNNVVVKHVSKEQFEQLDKTCNLEEEYKRDLLGFTNIFRLLTSLKKPIVGHNILSDLIIMTNCFERTLPNSYIEFKAFLHSLFPIVYDTKTLSFSIRHLIAETKRWKKNSLGSLYEFFKDGAGRHLALNSPYIEMVGDKSLDDQFHNAGWDSYCTGYIFIRMAHIFASQLYPVSKNKTFMSSELLNAVSQYKNSLNIIRGSVSFIQLDGKDPDSKRPPWLVIESVKNKPIDLLQVTSVLSSYGYIEVRPLCKKGQRALIAVDNFGSARRILSQFKSHSDFHIRPYSVFQHSPYFKTSLWLSTAASGLLMVWFLHSVLPKKM